MDLDSHQISFRCDLRGTIARKIAISDRQGWVVVATDSCELFLFSVNGHLIRDTVIERDIIHWKCFTNSEGLDFMAICDAKGDVKVCELFYLDFSRPLLHERRALRLLDYDSSARAFVMVIDGGACAIWKMPVIL
jgi:hypothetical protein